MCATALVTAGCASEAERYAWNVAHVRICGDASKLSRQDVAEIARLVAHVTRQNAITIRTAAPEHSLRKLVVGTAFPVAFKVDNPNRTLFGFCVVERIGQSWKATAVYTDVDPLLTFTSCE
jgi:hypothetical protein